LGPLVKTLERHPNHVYFNAQFDIQFLMAEGMKLPVHIKDSMLAAHLVDENEPSHALKTLGDKYIGTGASAEQKALDTILLEHKLKKNEMGKLDPALVAPYAEQDVRLTTQLLRFYEPKLAAWHISHLFDEANEYARALTDMSVTGIAIDVNLTRQYLEECGPQTDAAKATLRKLADNPNLNPASAPQMKKLLGLPSTAAPFLERLQMQGKLSDEQKTLVDAIQLFRSWNRTAGAYYQPYLESMDENGVLHPTFNQARVVTGRLSCSDPNLQAIPRHDDRVVGKVKNIFIARPGFTLANADYGQAELRMLAHYTQDQEMIDLFLSGVDFHGATAEQFHMSRDVAKRINFGIAYGLGKRGLSERTGLTEQQAAAHLKRYHNGHPGIRRLMNMAESTAVNRGYIRMWTGRPARFPAGARDAHKAMSTLIQGGVGEVMRVKITELHKGLPRFGARMTLQVHDSIMFEIPDENLQETLAYIRATMTDLPFSCPFIVDIEVGKRWGTAEKVKQGVAT